MTFFKRAVLAAALVLLFAGCGGRPTKSLMIATIEVDKGLAYYEYSDKLEALGGTKPYTWCALSELPPGLKLNRDTGEITGYPDSPENEEQTWEVQVLVTDSRTPPPC